MMELVAETTFLIGFGILALVYFVSIIGSLSFDFGELLKVFFIPGYALKVAWRDHSWLKPVFITGCGIAFIGLILTGFS